MQTELPAFPWQRVGSDLFVLNGVSYLLIVDYFSRFLEAIIPETVMSNNRPQYASQEFTEFARSYDFCHVTSSPHFPQSNGQAERTVQTVKKLLKESDDPYMALLNYRTTSFPWCGLSPAQLLMGRQLRANLPLTEEQLCPQWPYLGEFRRQNNLFKSKQKRDYDRRHRVRSLPLIPDDSEVWDTSGDRPTSEQVVAPASAPRSYLVETPSGQVRRKRRHLNVVPNGHSRPNSEEQPNYTSQRRILTRSQTGTTVRPPDRL